MKNKDILIEIKKKHFCEYHNNPDIIAIAPGRVNIIGEHTDYNNGLAMPAAISKYIFVSLSFNSKDMLRAYSDQMKKVLSVDLEHMIASDSWHQYILGSVKEIFENYNVRNGIDILIYSNLPIGKGISSSAALEVALVNGILNLFKIEENNDNIIKICQEIDHKYIGIKSGILDQSASQLSRKGSVLKIDFDKNLFSYIDVDFSDFSWVLVDSMIKRELASSKYHERVDECIEGLSILSNLLEREVSCRGISLYELSLLQDLHPILGNRIQHIIEENERVEKMEKALLEKNLIEIGVLLNNSHISLRDLYEVSCKEIDYLISISSKLGYWYGGRIMGGGFGGSTINLVKKGEEEKYSEFIRRNYKNKFKIKADIYNIKFSKGVEIINNISTD